VDDGLAHWRYPPVARWADRCAGLRGVAPGVIFGGVEQAFAAKWRRLLGHPYIHGATDGPQGRAGRCTPHLARSADPPHARVKQEFHGPDRERPQGVRFEDFEGHARAEWERIPDDFKAGVDGLIIDRQARPHHASPDVYTLGECVTEAYPSEFGGPETTRSAVVLYYGSFLRLSRLDTEFDWKAEIWETLTHELRHHLESLATEDALAGVDYAMDENFRRLDGVEFDPFFYRSGEPLGDGRFRLESSVFVERDALDDEHTVEFDVDGIRYRVAAPAASADVMFITLTGGAIDPRLEELCLVLVRPAGLRRTLGSLFRRRIPAVAELEAEAERIGG
jgi:hypothetical protein